MTKKVIETLTLHDLAELFREYGLPCSEQIIGEYIRQGKYPFALGVVMPGGKANYQIYKREAVEWLEAKATLTERPDFRTPPAASASTRTWATGAPERGGAERSGCGSARSGRE